MSYEQKPADAYPPPDGYSQPPQYGAQSPPPTNQTTYPPPGQDHIGQYQSQQQIHQAQSPPAGQYEKQHMSHPQQGYPQQPQQSYQQQGYQQQHQQQPQQSQGMTMPIASLTQSPAPIHCPSCGANTMTATTQVVGNTTHGWAAAICCCFCLGCIPYLMSSLKDVEHRCGKCGVHLATWHKSGRTDVKIPG